MRVIMWYKLKMVSYINLAYSTLLKDDPGGDWCIGVNTNAVNQAAQEAP